MFRQTAVALTDETTDEAIISKDTITSAVNSVRLLIEINSYMYQVTLPSDTIDMYD
jgi:hypothetical protein